VIGVRSAIAAANSTEGKPGFAGTKDGDKGGRSHTMKQWKTDSIGAGDLDEVLNELSQDGYEIYTILPAGVPETFLVVACKEARTGTGTARTSGS
jgi:hypothetical protein